MPDGCIVLFSGLGPNAQDELQIGVGALAGSTIMLLTIPWFLSILGGRVNINPSTQLAEYKTPKLTPPDNISLKGTGVAVTKNVNISSYIMLATSITYLILQVPGLAYINSNVNAQAAGERNWAILGLLMCLGFFAFYLYYQYKISDEPQTAQQMNRDEYIKKAITSGEITLLGVMIEEFNCSDSFRARRHSVTYQNSPSINSIINPVSNGKYSGLPLNTDELTSLSNIKTVPDESMLRLERLLRPFFKTYDTDGSGKLCMEELYAVFSDIGEKIHYKDFSKIFDEFDIDHDGEIDYPEFVKGTATYIFSNNERFITGKSMKKIDENTRNLLHQSDNELNEEDSGEEVEELPEDIRDLTPEQQQWRIKLKSAYMMGLGTLILLVVSDPTVDVLSEIGRRTNIPSFYVAFILAPLCSNASEVIAAYNYSMKKTEKTITISLATLQGAAVMNNTFVLGTVIIYSYIYI